MIPITEGTIYYRNIASKIHFLPSGTLIDHNKIVYEDCEAEYYKVVANRFMLCLESGQWEPFVRDKLCLSNYCIGKTQIYT